MSAKRAWRSKLESFGVSVIQAICPHNLDCCSVFVVKGSNFDLQVLLALMDQAVPTAWRSVIGGRANLTGVYVNTGTLFTNAKVDGCTIARHTLECLKDYGGLTPGQRMVMNIVDDVARLRASYSGFQQWAHLIALTLFVFPYAWFLIKSWTHAKFSSADGESTITLFFALIRFIWNGGQNLRDGPSFDLYAVSLFGIALTYNGVRALLLWKTKSLELKQEASGLPAIFSLRGFWGVFFQIARWLFYINLFVVFLHSMYFLGQRIPTSVLP